MQRLYNCPNCRAPVAPMQKFCGHCGTRLQPAQWNCTDTRPMTAPYQTDFAEPQMHDHQPQNMRIKDAARQVNTATPPGKKTRPMRREILNLLSSLVESQSVHN
jgi:predicted amidophosphoribosyltransferase